MKQIRSSLRAKLLIICVILTTIPLSIVGVVSYSKSFMTIEENTVKSATQIAYQLNKSVELIFKDSEKFLKIGNHETTIRFVNPYKQSEEKTYRSALEIIGLFKLFRDIYEFDTMIKGIYILGFNGNNINERDGRYTLKKNIHELETVKRILSKPGEATYVPNRTIDYAPENIYTNVISVGKAIIRPSTRDIMGVIIVDVDQQAIVELCKNIKMGDTGYFSIVTPERKFLYPVGEIVDESELSPANLKRIIQEDEGNFIQRVSGEMEFFIFNTLKNTGWKIIGRVKLKELMRGAYQIRNITLTVVLICIIFIIILYFFISDALTHPIRDLKEKMEQAESGNLEVRASCDNRDEIADLCHSFNVMICKLKGLLEYSIKEQEELKKSELKALQAQINPHFLYNTLDAIVWMTEADNKEEVKSITKNLSSFFRIALSKGEEWISVADETDHVRSYLTIQKVRYRDILDYELDVDPAIHSCKVLKLTLQPLVENAIYHGIKAKRNGGTIRVSGKRVNEETIRFDIIDTGAGIDAEKLRKLRECLEEDFFELSKDSGFGLKNVNQRIKLYYGKQWGLSIESEPGEGTHVYLEIPAIR